MSIKYATVQVVTWCVLTRRKKLYTLSLNNEFKIISMDYARYTPDLNSDARGGWVSLSNGIMCSNSEIF